MVRTCFDAGGGEELTVRAYGIDAGGKGTREDERLGESFHVWDKHRGCFDLQNGG